MVSAYQNRYAGYYDLLYRDKDYEAECDFLEQIVKKYARSPVKTILEGGCGTGGHALPLARRGYHVTGFDLSEAMIEVASRRAEQEKISTTSFTVADLRRFDLKKKFDLCLCMFSALGYVNETEGIISAFASMRKHLKKGSLFIFDVWNGLAVMHIQPSLRTKEVRAGEKRLLRIAQPELDALHHVCRVHYTMLVMANKKLLDEIKETHSVRFFFPLEIAHYLKETGFDVVTMCPFLDLGGKLDENVWNMTIVARAV